MLLHLLLTTRERCEATIKVYVMSPPKYCMEDSQMRFVKCCDGQNPLARIHLKIRLKVSVLDKYIVISLKIPWRLVS